MEKIDIIAFKYALQNALKYNGKAQPGSVIGKILKEHQWAKKDLSLLKDTVNNAVIRVNSMSLIEQQKTLSQIAPELLETKQKEQDLFAFLDIKGGVVTAFPPEPSKYPHIGHAKAILLNYELAKRHNGRFILRFEDTNPTLAKEEYYLIHEENYAWLGVNPDMICYVSDYVEDMYRMAERLISKGQAYVCFCALEKMRENRANGVSCECREQNMSLELWQRLFKLPEGEAVLRAKIDMLHQNTSMRDPTLFRIIDAPHPRTGKRFRVWPTYDFENAFMDGMQNVTVRLRSKEFELRNELQRYLQGVMGFKSTKIFEFGRLNLAGVPSSGRIIREMIEKKELLGWDDPALTTIVALRRRGFLAEAIKSFVFSTGISKAEATLTWEDLYVHNRRLVDKTAVRYFFLPEPVEIKILGSPAQKIRLKKHPEQPEKGYREYNVRDRFLLAKTDFDSLEEGNLYRLMDCLNFRKEGNSFVFDSLEYEKYKKEGSRIMHFVPVIDGVVDVKIIMPDKKVVTGVGEPMLSDIGENEVVQLERVGFAKLDSKKDMTFWYTHP